MNSGLIVINSDVGGLEHDWIIFPYLGNVIIPIDELIFFRQVETINQWVYKIFEVGYLSYLEHLTRIYGWLVVWKCLEPVLFFLIYCIGHVIIPTDELIFFRGVG